MDRRHADNDETSVSEIPLAMDQKTRQSVASSLRLAAQALSANQTWGDIGAGRKFLVDGEPAVFEDLWLANAEDEDFIEALVALEVGGSMQWGGGAAAEFEIKRTE